MIRAAFERNAQGQLTGFTAKGHSGYAASGSDIVCAGMSVLATTCVNSLEALCGISTDSTVTAYDEKTGLMSFQLPSDLPASAMHDAQLLMQSFWLGVQSMAEQYPRYLQLTIQLSNTNGGKHND